jgi:hypothetical protein
VRRRARCTRCFDHRTGPGRTAWFAAAGGAGVDGKATTVEVGRCWHACAPSILGNSLLFRALQGGLGLGGLASSGARALLLRADRLVWGAFKPHRSIRGILGQKLMLRREDTMRWARNGPESFSEAILVRVEQVCPKLCGFLARRPRLAARPFADGTDFSMAGNAPQTIRSARSRSAPAPLEASPSDPRPPWRALSNNLSSRNNGVGVCQHRPATIAVAFPPTPAPPAAANQAVRPGHARFLSQVPSPWPPGDMASKLELLPVEVP